VKGYHEIRDERFQSVIDRPLKSIKWQETLNKETCSPKTLKNAWRLVSSAMRYVDFPVPVVTLAQVPKTERAYLEPDQIPDFIKAVHGTECEIPALLALSSLRRSEILALTWEDIDLAKKRIHVSGAMVCNDDGKLIDKPQNKNASSCRYVPLMISELEAALKEAPKAVEDKTDKVVTVYPNTPSRRINKICAANGFPLVGVHGLRHSFASLAYHLHIPEKIAMQIGGWASLETMTKIYTHLSAKDIGLCENELTAFFKNANENANGTTGH